MMRNLIVLGCSAFLALALSLTSYGGILIDTDLDGVADEDDVCRVDPDGPDLGACDQDDADGDGYGNACDTDTNNNNQTDTTDVLDTLAASNASSTVANFDFNCNGQADTNDVLKALADSNASKLPGPSCLHPSGTPCP